VGCRALSIAQDDLQRSRRPAALQTAVEPPAAQGQVQRDDTLDRNALLAAVSLGEPALS
jgi:hypothetical protein